MQIHWVLDNPDEINPSEPLGSILIRADCGEISESNIFLDTFLSGLARGAVELQAKSAITIDLIDEPDPILLERSDSGLYLSYQGREMRIESLEGFIINLVKCIEAFLEVIDSASPPAGPFPRMQALRDFVRRAGENQLSSGSNFGKSSEL